MPQKYYTIVTDTGVAAMTNALARGTKVDMTYIAVGDGGGGYYEPQSTQTALKHEVWRGVVTKCEQDPLSPNIINISAVIPSDVGGWTIREIAVYDSNDSIIAVAIADGVIADIEINMQLVVSNTNAIDIKVDPTVIIATKADISTHNADPNAHTGLTRFAEHINNADIHISADDRTRWDGANTLSKSNKIEIDAIKLQLGGHNSRITRLEDCLFNEIIGNPWLLTFANLDGIKLINGCYNQQLQRLEC